MVKLQESKSRFFVSVPKVYVKTKKWEKGQELLFSLNKDGNLEIHEV